MTNEAMACLKPIGYAAPESERKTTTVDTKLSAFFLNWISEGCTGLVTDSKIAYASLFAVKHLEVSVEEAHALVLTHQDHKDIERAGLFLSLVYRLCSKKVIFLDVDIPTKLCGVGYYLSADKTLVNYSNIYSAGNSSDALFVNCGNVYEFYTDFSAACVINYGGMDLCRLGNTGTFVVNAGKIQNLALDGRQLHGICFVDSPNTNTFGYSLPLLKAEDTRNMPELITYFADLKSKLDKARTDFSVRQELEQTLSKQKIQADLEMMLTDRGYEW